MKYLLFRSTKLCHSQLFGAQWDWEVKKKKRIQSSSCKNKIFIVSDNQLR